MRRIFGTQSATLYWLSYNFLCVFAFLVQLPLCADSLLQPHYGVLLPHTSLGALQQTLITCEHFRFGSNRSELVCSTWNTHIWKVGVRFIISRFPRTTLPSRKFHDFLDFNSRVCENKQKHFPHIRVCYLLICEVILLLRSLVASSEFTINNSLCIECAEFFSIYIIIFIFLLIFFFLTFV